MKKIFLYFFNLVVWFVTLISFNLSAMDEADKEAERKKAKQERKFDEQWKRDKTKFDGHYKSLPHSASQAIGSYCEGRDQWFNNLNNLEQRNDYDTSLIGCVKSLRGPFKSKQDTFKNLIEDFSSQQSLARTNQVFRGHEESTHSISEKIQAYQSAEYYGYIQRVTERGGSHGGGAGSMRDRRFASILRQSTVIGLVHEAEQTPVIEERKTFLTHYARQEGCKEEGDNANVSDCYNQVKSGDKKCIEKYGFEKCRPFLEGSNCQPKAVVDLASELSKDDKGSMAYACWKAAAQGAQCCINPDQCPTDGAFRNIADQLKKAAPGLVKAFAGLEAIKGNYQEACQANLLANAAGPLSQLQTKTCGDSATACEETCDKRVQEFKESFKQAVLGGQPQGKKQEEKPPTIDEIVAAAEEIEGDNPLLESDDDSDTDVTKEIKTCAQAVVYLNNKFKKKTDDKKSIKLSEKLSHASLVDCTDEIFKHSGGNSSGGASPASGLGSMNPMAAQMCRQGHPDGPLPPRLPVVGPTPNPNMGPGHLFGSKTRRGPGGNFIAPGAGVPPPDEFIEPERGPAGANALNGGWTDTGSGMGPGGSSGPGGSGLPGSPSRDDEGGSGDTGDNLPIAYPEAFDSGGGGFDSGGGDMGSEGSPLMQMAKYMEKKDLEEARKKEEERLKEIDAQGSIFSRLSQTIRAYCQQENCPEE